MCRGIFRFFKAKQIAGLLLCNLSRSWPFLQYRVSCDALVWLLPQQWLRVPAIVSVTPVPAVLGVSPLISFPNYQPDPTLFSSQNLTGGPTSDQDGHNPLFMQFWHYSYPAEEIIVTHFHTWRRNPNAWGINERKSHCDTVRAAALCQRLHFGTGMSFL